ncbi:Bug family tripartite tricarboxylate transporter substrate binding protein [Ramlibacter sp. MAHUQ-53]|uniref:Bug family tripartite tricarboxylate transporter substrate binding protein n=1 Tax=unclassified Ramlibacter TaxID=2617605 RepID=UPI0036264614
MFPRRSLLACVAAPLLAAAAAGVHAQADDFPSRPVTLVAPFPAGSVTDAVTRVLATALSTSLGKPVVVENKAGAQGTIGAAYVANAKPDGYTLLVGSSGMFVARSLYKTLPYDPMESFTPVAGVGSTAMMFLVAANSPLRSIADLAKASKQAQPPVSMAYGSPSGQVAVSLFSTVTDSKPIAVSYRGIPQAITDLIGGQVQVAAVDIGSALAQINGKTARALAISSAQRYAGAPEVPTLQEAFPRAAGSLETIIAIMAPAGTPAPVVAKLEAALGQALATTPVKAQFQVLNTSVLPLSSKDLAARLRTDNPRWERLMKQAGIEPQ